MKQPIQFLIDSQIKFQKKLGTWPGDIKIDLSNIGQEVLNTSFIRDSVLYTIDELSEMMREIPFNKGWKDYTQFDREKHLGLAREEYIDAMHFFINIGAALGMTEDMIMEEYCRKHAINYTRQEEGYKFNE